MLLHKWSLFFDHYRLSRLNQVRRALLLVAVPFIDYNRLACLRLLFDVFLHQWSTMAALETAFSQYMLNSHLISVNASRCRAEPLVLTNSIVVTRIDEDESLVVNVH